MRLGDRQIKSLLFKTEISSFQPASVTVQVGNPEERFSRIVTYVLHTIFFPLFVHLSVNCVCINRLTQGYSDKRNIHTN